MRDTRDTNDPWDTRDLKKGAKPGDSVDRGNAFPF
jgi:hypothetical protein